MVTSDPSGSRPALGLLLVFLLVLAPGCATPDPTPPTGPEPQAGTPQPPPARSPGQATTGTVVQRIVRPAATSTQATASPRAGQRGTPPASTQTSDPGSRYLSSGVTGALTIETLPPRPPSSAGLDAAE